MKRIVATVIALVMFLTSAACAESIGINPIVIHEDFSIRNGVGYGSTLDEVMIIEEKNVSRRDDDEDLDLIFTPGYSIAYDTVLANGEAHVAYFFDDNGAVQEIQYWLPYRVELRDALIEKYGDCNYHKNLSALSTNLASFNKDFIKYIDGGARQYSGWMVKYNDCWVLIEFMYYISFGEQYSRINYRIITDDEMQTYVEIENMKTVLYNNSITNDL